MSKLLVIACGGTKHAHTARAIDLYKGRQFALARKLYAKGWEVLILSAEHGFIPADRVIAPYNRKMDKARAAELTRDEFQVHVFRIWAEDMDEVVFYGGETYADVWSEMVDRLHLAEIGKRKTIVRIVGRGCGDHYSVLKATNDNEPEPKPVAAAA